MTLQHIARGQRGDYNPAARPGDLCAIRAAQQAGAREGYERAIKASRDSLAGNDELEIVSIPGGRTFAVPAEVVRHIRAEAEAVVGDNHVS